MNFANKLSSFFFFGEEILNENEKLFPRPIWLEIFSYLSLKELATCSLVCKSWKNFCREDILFQPFCKNFGLEGPLEGSRLRFIEFITLANLSNKEKPVVIKTIVIGDAFVGKTSLLTKYTTGKMELPITNIGAEFFSKTISVYGVQLKLQLWDTAGKEHFGELPRMYYRGADIILLCFDLSNYSSFLALPKYIKEIESKRESLSEGIVLCGLKSDLSHNVPPSEIQAFVDKYHFKYFEISSKEMINVELPFREVAKNFIPKKLVNYPFQSKQSSNCIIS